MLHLDLDGARILVVGASSGVGRGVATSAGLAGAAIAAVGRRTALLNSTIAAAGGGTAIVADISKADDCARAVDEALAALGGFDAIVHAVGIEFPMLLADSDARNWDETFATNVTGPSLITSRALGSLSPGGVVGFMSSSSRSGYHGLTPYAASKAALEATVRGFALEHPTHRFIVLGVGPTVGTDMSRNFDERAAGLFAQWLAHGVLTQRCMEANDLGRAITEVLAMLLAHPGVNLPEIIFFPPGAIRTEDDTVQEMVDIIDEVADRMRVHPTP
jgi:NAD(P)-dependent dehydrogenase (short-subunit alcohol dehydrogenase family)